MKTTALGINTPAVQKFARSPALLSPAQTNELVAFAGSPARTADTTRAALEQSAASYGTTMDNARKPFLFVNGMAIIPVWGALLHRDPWFDGWATGYDYIAARFMQAVADDDVKAIVFDMNSYGGHVAGNFELCEMIYEARGVKPIIAVVDARALSGGYSIASAAEKIYATPSADIGSIGVVMTHMSYEKMMDEIGIEVTFVFAGDHKVDGNPYENLSDDVKAALQASVERSYEQFVSLVARNRGIDADAVRATQARVYDAEEAKRLGLVDDVMSPRAAYAAITAGLESESPTPSLKEAKKMTDQNTGKKVGGDGEEELTRADIARAEQQAASAAMQRVAGILDCDEAKGREAQARVLALQTTMSVDEAKVVLAAAPVAAPADDSAKGKGRLAAAMESDANVTVGVEDDAAKKDTDKPTESRASRLSASYAQATGRTVTKS